MSANEFFPSIRSYAIDNRVPIIEQDSVQWLDSFLCDKTIENVLEIGSAIGYSALCFNKITGSRVVTVERDENRFNEAKKNITEKQLEQYIQLYFEDATSEKFFEIAKKHAPYDILYIDATKRENRLFFETFAPFVKVGGYIITDNINFHDLTGTEDEIMQAPRRLRPMLRSIVAYKEWLPTLSEFDTTFIEVGDTLAVSKKIKDVGDLT